MIYLAAASARLCVETCDILGILENLTDAAASARLCVETSRVFLIVKLYFAAASARLCVETQQLEVYNFILTAQPPPRGCVLKR